MVNSERWGSDYGSLTTRQCEAILDILDAADEPMPIGEIVKRLPWSKQTIKSRMTAMRAEGRIAYDPLGFGWYKRNE